jgi:uncharacterized protein (TIGR02466 family)
LDLKLRPGVFSSAIIDVWSQTVANPGTANSAELTNKQLLMLFPTPMFMGNLPDITLCERIEKNVREMRMQGKGQFSPKNASPAFMTADNLHTLPEMKELVDVVMMESGRIFDAYAIKRDAHYITGMWANITHPNHRQNMHVHPNCMLSGLVYIKAPVNCGPTMFASPRKFTKNLELKYLTRNELNSDFIVVPAEKGRMLFWPSHIPHAVEQGTADENEERIVVAFNMMIRGHIELFTASMTFA